MKHFDIIGWRGRRKVSVGVVGSRFTPEVKAFLASLDGDMVFFRYKYEYFAPWCWWRLYDDRETGRVRHFRNNYWFADKLSGPFVITVRIKDAKRRH
ncbi:MAG: hypothetical protein CSA97_05235 [Bacteroidetes bacterium]|nr:MAG: hypothetical protein CSA97_05235 [Bacteroidota bacterium]